MNNKIVLLYLLLVAPLFIHAQTEQGCSCIDLQDKIRLIQETDAINNANLKAQIEIQQNITQEVINRNNLDLKNYIDRNDRGLYLDLHHDLVNETSPYKQVIPMALASLTIITLFITYMVWRGR